jgi:Flp pilus assembly protein TadD
MNQLYKIVIFSGLTAVSSIILPHCPVVLSQLINLPNDQLNSTSSLLEQHKSATYWLGQGAAKALNGDYMGAVAYYNQSLSRNPSNADTYYNRGVAYYQLGQQQQAWQDFNQAIKLNSTLAPAYGNRGELRYQMGDRIGARQDFQQAAKLFARQGEWVSSQQMKAESEKLQR